MMEKIIVSDFSEGRWKYPKALKYSPIKLDPRSKILHYGQSVFEGVMAYPLKNGYWSLFRVGDHYRRFSESCLKLAIPTIPEDFFITSIRKILACNKPNSLPLYIRPFVISTGSGLDPFSFDSFKFMVIAEEVEPHFKKESINVISAITTRPTSLSGSSGVKTGGNYASCLLAETEARARGADMVLWLDSKRYVSELSGMNIFFVSKGVLHVPDSIMSLKGITRDSILRISRRMGLEVILGHYSLKSLLKADEVFASGTRCHVVPITELDGECFNIGPITRRISQELGLAKRGIGDDYGWTKEVRYRDKN